MASNNAKLLGGAAGAVVLALVVVWMFPSAPVDVATVSDAPQVAVSDNDAPVAPAKPAQVTSIDTFLLGPDGVAVVAGRAKPNAEVTLMLDGVAVGQARSDASGAFAGTAEIAATDQTRALTFAVDGAAAGGDTILVQAGTGGPAADVDIDTQMAQVAESAMPPETQGSGVQADPPAANIIVTADGARVAPNAAPSAQVALDAITYDDSGEVQLAGRAPQDGNLRVYLDNAPVSDAPVSGAGDFQIALPDVAAGTYTLRIDEIAADGTVASRVETPFQKEDPAAIRALRDDAQAVQQIATSTVQPGASLWAIATDRFGDGRMYVAVFEANRDQIRDPDLIYPGQVFVIPDM
ncbi:hypothetical protein SAMN05428995_103153 [Loktanella sp. DSM 29012]|uniref:LysM peptidoglycan-binding domain-containing protein n=1 Tax=Loktanella sp. DSM 29012 TaxID=1881056 RepID=UPI0008D1C1D6|nr:LysM peptidoglycan-binding domain-containing protein [Loktanella sp. DSM 29012]SEQ18742.1 hypothetical protein SAMN05428995_103153 [Loktanella sp. DSM 29012]